MKAEFEISMTKRAMYGFLMYHSYHSFSGIFSIIAGLALLLLFGWCVRTGDDGILYLFFGVLFLIYQPWTLLMAAARQVASAPAFRQPLSYAVTEEGISVRQGDEEQTIGWEAVRKVRETSRSLFVYTGKKVAFIWIKEQMGEQENTVRTLLQAHLTPGTCRLRNKKKS